VADNGLCGIVVCCVIDLVEIFAPSCLFSLLSVALCSECRCISLLDELFICIALRCVSTHPVPAHTRSMRVVSTRSFSTSAVVNPCCCQQLDLAFDRKSVRWFAHVGTQHRLDQMLCAVSFLTY